VGTQISQEIAIRMDAEISLRFEIAPNLVHAATGSAVSLKPSIVGQELHTKKAYSFANCLIVRFDAASQ
jgi:hypothetical protein